MDIREFTELTGFVLMEHELQIINEMYDSSEQSMETFCEIWRTGDMPIMFANLRIKLLDNANEVIEKQRAVIDTYTQAVDEAVKAVGKMEKIIREKDEIIERMGESLLSEMMPTTENN